LPSDVLTALLGAIASTATGYTETKEKLRKEQLAAGETAAERAGREKLAGIEAKSRTDVANIGALTDKEIAKMKLDNERTLLAAQIEADRAKWSSANAIDRDKLAADIDNNTARLKQLDRELSLKSREIDIDQAYKLGTGKLGTGSRLGGGKGSEPFGQQLILEMIKRYDPLTTKPEKFLGDIKTALDLFGSGEYKPPVVPGAASPSPVAPQLGPQRPATFDINNPLGATTPPSLGELGASPLYPTSESPNLGTLSALIDSLYNKPNIPINLPVKRARPLKP
jgi:hypothetical protein